MPGPAIQLCPMPPPRVSAALTADLSKAHGQFNVFIGGHGGNQIKRLKHHAHGMTAILRQIVRRHGGKVLAFHHDSAGIGRSRPAMRFSSVDFPEPEAPEQSNKLSSVGGDAYAVHRRDDTAPHFVVADQRNSSNRFRTVIMIFQMYPQEEACSFDVTTGVHVPRSEACKFRPKGDRAGVYENTQGTTERGCDRCNRALRMLPDNHCSSLELQFSGPLNLKTLKVQAYCMGSCRQIRYYNFRKIGSLLKCVLVERSWFSC